MEKNDSKIKYLFYECFGTKDNDTKTMLEKLKQELDSSHREVIQKMEQFFKMTSLKQSY